MNSFHDFLAGFGRYFRPWWGLLVYAGFWVSPVPAANPTVSADEGWVLLSGYLFRDAHDAFTGDHGPVGRQRQLGEAASLINDPPVTGAKISRAESLLENLVNDVPGDEVALFARYLSARIKHVHRDAPVTETESAYRAVMLAAPDHALAQVAASKLALVLLYQRPDLSIAERLQAAAELEALAARAALSETACAYYRALVGAALFYDVVDERVLTWLQRAEALGSADVLAAAGIRIQLAEVARTLGRRQEAIGYYQSFLDSILPTDNRYRTARERMLELMEAQP
ncbi:MAG: hypothetical protein K9N01_07265 [Cephaloticoccus sp.]|nr:hypothetical protein [Cephaloticoccus sp.]